MPFPNTAARTGGQPRGGSAPSQHGGNLAQFPALCPWLGRGPPAFHENQLRGGHVVWRRGPVIGRVVMTSDAAAPHARTRARAQSRASETRRRSVRPGRSLMRSRKVRGPQAGCAPPSRTLPGEPAGGGRLSASSSAPGRGARTPAPASGGGEETCTFTHPRRGAPGSLAGVTATRTRALPPAVRTAAGASCPPALPTDEPFCCSRSSSAKPLCRT